MQALRDLQILVAAGRHDRRKHTTRRRGHQAAALLVCIAWSIGLDSPTGRASWADISAARLPSWAWSALARQAASVAARGIDSPWILPGERSGYPWPSDPHRIWISRALQRRTRVLGLPLSSCHRRSLRRGALMVPLADRISMLEWLRGAPQIGAALRNAVLRHPSRPGELPPLPPQCAAARGRARWWRVEGERAMGRQAPIVPRGSFEAVVRAYREHRERAAAAAGAVHTVLPAVHTPG